MKYGENGDDLFISNGNGENVFDMGMDNVDIDDDDDDDDGIGIGFDKWADNQFIPELGFKVAEEFANIDAEGCNIVLVKRFKSGVTLTSRPANSSSEADIFLSDINSGGGGRLGNEGILSKNCDLENSFRSLEIGGPTEPLSLNICEVKPSKLDILLFVSSISRDISFLSETFLWYFLFRLENQCKNILSYHARTCIKQGANLFEKNSAEL